MYSELTFKHLWSHPGCAAFIVGHVGLNITRGPKVTDLQHGATSHQQQTETQQEEEMVNEVVQSYRTTNIFRTV